MIRLSKIWPLLLLLSVCTYNTHSLSLLSPTPPAPPTFIPDATMSTPMTYPPPPACMTYDGIVLDLTRGEFRMIDCQYCYCEYDGTAYCYYGECWPPALCVDPVSDGCCSSCPNGYNCLLPSGEILPEGEVRIYENMECACRNPYNDEHYYDYYLSYDYNQQQAVCLPMPIPMGPCDYVTCLPLMCVDAVTPLGGCCPECINGNNCYMPSGEIIPVNEIRLFENMLCKCPDELSFQWGENREAECFPVSTTPPITSTTPAGCRSWDGQFLDLQPGESRINGCEYCYCSYDGTGYCAYAYCMAPQCVDAVTPPGGCCPQCPDGPNCQLPSGGILKAGETIDENGMRCSCALDSYSWGPMLAECVPSGCRNWNDELLDMKPGDFVQNGCESCYCDWDGRAYCYSMPCLPPPCLDAVLSSDGCCYECPNGPNCRNWNDELVDMKPGDSSRSGCDGTYCDWDGRAYSYHLECTPPPCINAVLSSDGCCYECPNGPNCQLPSGGILKAGETIDENGMNCSCPLDTYNYDYGYYNWGPVSLCQPSGCRTMDGQLLDLLPGESRASECEYCSCGPDGVGYCVYPTCPPPPCVDAVVPPSGCCAECLNGQNCKLPDGNILHGSEPQEVDGMVCQCPELSYEFGSETEERHITAECFSIPTTGTTPFFTTETYPTTPPLGCLTSDGNFMYPGEEKETIGPGYCHILKCTYDSNLEEMWGDCIPAMCVDAHFSGCCLSCPNGQNCKLPNGKILHGSEPQEIDGMVCQCPEQSFEFGSATEERHITAKCTTGTTPFFTTTEAYPTTPPLGCMTSDGNFIYPGEEKMTVGPGYCHILICTFDSNLEEMFGDCIPAMCVDARSSGCCPSCPNGQNCRLPNGSILHGSEPQEIDGMVCKCPETSYDIGIPTLDQHITAECYAASTVSDTPCLTAT